MKENFEILEISDEDIRIAFKEINAYFDISLEDFKEIYRHALNHAKQRLSSVAVGKIMTAGVITITGNSDIQEAVRLLSENKISGLPVVDDKNKVIGIVTHKDIIVAAGIAKDHTFRDILRHIIGEPAPHYHKALAKKVKDIMTSPAITVFSDTGIKEAANKLVEFGINSLPVVDKNGGLIGIISTGDIVNNTGSI